MRRLIERRRGYHEAGGPELVKPLPACEERMLVAVVDRVDRCAVPQEARKVHLVAVIRRIRVDSSLEIAQRTAIRSVVTAVIHRLLERFFRAVR